MSAAIAMQVPGSRPIVGWWRDLAGHQPCRLWFAHLVLHRLEVLVECETPSALDALRSALLARIQSQPPPVDLHSLQADLAIDATLFQQLVDRLVAQGTLTLDGAGRVVQVGIGSPAPPRLRQRRILHFTDGTPTHFLPLQPSVCSALMPPLGWGFDVNQLDHFSAQPLAWRQDNQFPMDVCCFLRPSHLPEPTQAEAVIVDRAEQSLLALIETGDQLLGFPVNPEGWELQRVPALVLPTASDFALALRSPVPIEPWRQAWQAWCQQRSLPAVDVEACQLDPIDHRLVVKAPARLLDRLRQGRSEAVRGEAWLLAGSGRIRHAALIDLT